MDDLEKERVEAEIAKLRAETDSLRRPSMLQRYLGLAAIIGALGGVAAFMQVIIQLRTLRFDLMENRYKAEGEAEDALKKAAEAQRQLAATKIALKSYQDSTAAYQKQNADRAEKSLAPNAVAKGVVQVFMRAGRGDGADCAKPLQTAGFTVGGVESINHGPIHDEVKYFRPEDEAGALAIGQALKTCGLIVPEVNYVLITDDSGSANSPPRYFEVWVGQER